MKHFLSSEFPPAAADAARFHIIPAPMELSVSYGRGASQGPAAILEASQQLEAFDGRGTPGEAGIFTAPVINPEPPSGENGHSCPFSLEKTTDRNVRSPLWLDAIERSVASALTCHALPILLGGEHTVTLGAARAFHKAGRKIGFLHFDAHADLRDEYEGSRFSHACVMRRVHELGFHLVQIGTRAYSLEEHVYRLENAGKIRAHDACENINVELLPVNFPQDVYVSFDVDAWDPSLMPATGTPVPGGLTWWDPLRLIRSLVLQTGRRIVGADVVELAPNPALPHADFTAARMVYALMGMMR